VAECRCWLSTYLPVSTVVMYIMDGSSGTLKTTIRLCPSGRNPAVVSPFYCMTELPSPSGLTGCVDLLSHFGLDGAYRKMCDSKKVKPELSSFLTNLPGNIDTRASQDGSSLRALLEKPPIAKPIHPLSSSQLAGFRLHVGALSDEFKSLAGLDSHVTADRGAKRLKRKRKHSDSAAAATAGDDGDFNRHGDGESTDEMAEKQSTRKGKKR